MNKDKIMRIALGATSVFNFIAAIAFAFPESILGQISGMPGHIPAIYNALLAYFVLIFDGMYIWLFFQKEILKPFVVVTSIGKAGVFLIIFTFCILGQLPQKAIIPASGDLFFACIFTWWLLTKKNN